LKTIAVVQARMGSTRLPGKVLMEAAGQPMLGHLLDRLARCQHLDDVWVATSDLPQDDAIAAYCQTRGTPCHRGGSQDVLSRYAAVLRHSRADHLVRITGDCPLMDPAVVDEVIQVHMQSSAPLRYTSNVFPRTYPRGMDVEVVCGPLIEELDRRTTELADREHVTTLAARGQIPDVHSQTVRRIDNLSAFRFTLDYPKDFEQIRTLIESGLEGAGLEALMQKARALGLDARDNHEASPFDVHALPTLEVHPLAARVVLGSAPFGVFHGRFNREGVPSVAHVQGILRGASQLGIGHIETSPSYGEAMNVLGECTEEMAAFKTWLTLPCAPGDWQAQLQRWHRLSSASRVDTVMLAATNEVQSSEADACYAQLQSLKQQGQIRHVGVFAQNAQQALWVHERFPLDVCVIPVHVLDQHTSDAVLRQRLSSAGVRVCAHSVFIQGLLFADPQNLPLSLRALAPALRMFQDRCAQAGVDPAHAALHHALNLPGVNQVMLGVESHAQLAGLFANLPAQLPMDWSGLPALGEEARQALDWSQ
jgi:spore coat polysaccharide biosynthesis protein SpsF